MPLNPCAEQVRVTVSKPGASSWACSMLCLKCSVMTVMANGDLDIYASHSMESPSPPLQARADHSGTAEEDLQPLSFITMILVLFDSSDAAQEEDERDLASLMAAADLDGDGTLNYEEFIAATASLSKLEREANILAAFKQFDTDHSGALSKSEVMAALTSMGSTEQEIEVRSRGGSLYGNFETRRPWRCWLRYRVRSYLRSQA